MSVFASFFFYKINDQLFGFADSEQKAVHHSATIVDFNPIWILHIVWNPANDGGDVRKHTAIRGSGVDWSGGGITANLNCLESVCLFSFAECGSQGQSAKFISFMGVIVMNA